MERKDALFFAAVWVSFELLERLESETPSDLTC